MLGGREAVAEPGAKKNLIVLFASGGWDTTYAIDPKPGLATIDAPAGDVEELAGIPILTAPTRPAVTDFFTDFGDITAVVNGIQTQSISHTSGALRVMTGSSKLGNPDIGTILAVEHGFDLAAPYLVLGTISYSGPYASTVTRTGTVNQLGTLLEPLSGFPIDDTVVTQRYLPSKNEADLIRAHVLAEAERTIAARGAIGRNARRMNDYVAGVDRSELLRKIGGLEGFNGTQDIAVQVDLAVDALDNGMSQAVQIEMTGFDTHVANAQQDYLWQGLFTQLHRLVTQLDNRGLLEDTVVVVMSEMGRTPKLNAEAGKDHWPVTSALLIGTEVDGGRVIGGTTDEFHGRNVDFDTGDPDPDGAPIRHGTFAAGVLEMVGVDPEPYLPGVTPLAALRA
jgi:hypothetical protein